MILDLGQFVVNEDLFSKHELRISFILGLHF